MTWYSEDLNLHLNLENKDIGENLIEHLSSRKDIVHRINSLDSQKSPNGSTRPFGMKPGADKSLNDLIEYLWNNIRGERGVTWLLIFISATENDFEITNFIREKTNNFAWSYYPKGFKEDPYDVVINDLRILNETLSYALRLRSLTLIEYILNSSENLYINASLSEIQLRPLLIDQDDENVQKILKFIVTKDIIIVNDGSLKLEESNDEEQNDDELMIRSISNPKFSDVEGYIHKANDEAFEKSISK